MFAPEGYTPLSKVRDDTAPSTASLKDRAQRLVSDFEETFSDTDQLLHWFWAVTPMDIHERRFFSAAQKHLRIAAPDGTVLKVDSAALFLAINATTESIPWEGHTGLWWWLSLPDLWATREFSQLPEDQLDCKLNALISDLLLNEPNSEAQASRWLKLREPSLEDNDAKPALWLTAAIWEHPAPYHTIPLCYSRSAMTINFTAVDYLSSESWLNFDHLRHQIDRLRKFEGWSLCVTDKAASDIREFMSSEGEAIGAQKALQKVSRYIRDETLAYEAAKDYLTSLAEDQIPRQAELKRLIGCELGTRAWTRVVGRLRPDFPNISMSGASKKE